MPNFPNVPNLPGVPAVPRSPSFPTAAAPVIQLSALASRIFDLVVPRQQWGVFNKDLKPVLIVDSVLSFSNRNESSVTNAPLQEGGFASYNKISNPFEASLRVTKGSSKANRAIFLRQLDQVMASLELYTIVTPERTYINVNMSRYEVTRTGAKDAYFLTEVDLFFVEIRQVQSQYVTTEQAAAGTFSAKPPSASPEQVIGNVKTSSVASPVGAKALAALQAGSL